jgi:hypothetical protein
LTARNALTGPFPAVSSREIKAAFPLLGLSDGTYRDGVIKHRG